MGCTILSFTEDLVANTKALFNIYQRTQPADHVSDEKGGGVGGRGRLLAVNELGKENVGCEENTLLDCGMDLWWFHLKGEDGGVPVLRFWWLQFLVMGGADQREGSRMRDGRQSARGLL
ncbi:hypothetical protein L1887_05536 [Cichorium endivia]|nr:hypothetical protein L1887_05536 [Cichorium endivia]